MAKKARKAKTRAKTKKVKRKVKAKAVRRKTSRARARKKVSTTQSWLGETAELRRRLAGHETFED